jgi:hypothetical protein
MPPGLFGIKKRKRLTTLSSTQLSRPACPGSFLGSVWGNADREGCLSGAGLSTSALPVDRAFFTGRL